MGFRRTNQKSFICLGLACALLLSTNRTHALAHARVPCYPMHGYGALFPPPLQGLVTDPDSSSMNKSGIVASAVTGPPVTAQTAVTPPVTNSFVVQIAGPQNPTNRDNFALWNLFAYVMEVCSFKGPPQRTGNFTCADWSLGITDLVINLEPKSHQVMLEMVSYPPDWLIQGFSCVDYINHAPFNPAVLYLPFKGQKNGDYIFGGHPFNAFGIISGKSAEIRVHADPTTNNNVITFYYNQKIVVQSEAIACTTPHCGLL